MIRKFASFLSVAAVCAGVAQGQTADFRTKLRTLSDDFWTWRATEQPFTNDDIPRIERPAGFAVHWSPEDAKGYRTKIAAFERQWRALKPDGQPVPDQVDYRLVGSAIARVYWELDVFPMWKQNPFFYVDQSLGSVYAELLPPPPLTEMRQQVILDRLEKIPAVLEAGKANLVDIRAPYARVTVSLLQPIEERMQRVHDELLPELTEGNKARFEKAEAAAVRALVEYRGWVASKKGLPEKTAVGRTGYMYFLRNVALMPYTPEDILRMGRQEWERSVGFEALAQAANSGLPQIPVYASVEVQVADEKRQERAMRKYMVEHGILSDPAEVKHYNYMAVPKYLAPLSFMGVTDSLTGPSHLEEDGTSYKGQPRTNGGFFSNITALDVRPLTIHEGMPGHYFQMAWSWRHPDPIRRHYYDSESNEGIGFYAEEMMMLGGVMEDQPRMKEAIYSMMRLRALRVEVDVRLALGEFTLEQAAEYLQNTVPMDAGTARSEAAMFASTPGQAITYQIGKLDIIRLMTNARHKQGSAFNLRNFHDYIWLNGNLPFSLDRWELLGDATEVPALPASFTWKATGAAAVARPSAK